MTAESLINLILLFFAYAFLGWCIEVTLKYFQFHRFINRGFLTGPWLPIYGSGAALITVVIKGLAPLEFPSARPLRCRSFCAASWNI